MWYAGFAFVSVGALYFGYKVISDPTIITGLFRSGSSPNTSGSETPTGGEIRISDARTGGRSITANLLAGLGTAASGIATGVSDVKHIIANTINPFNYFNTAAALDNNFRSI